MTVALSEPMPVYTNRECNSFSWTESFSREEPSFTWIKRISVCKMFYSGLLTHTGVGGCISLGRAVYQEMCCYYITSLKTDHILKNLYHHPYGQGAEPWNPFLAGSCLNVQFLRSINVQFYRAALEPFSSIIAAFLSCTSLMPGCKYIAPNASTYFCFASAVKVKKAKCSISIPPQTISLTTNTKWFLDSLC